MPIELDTCFLGLWLDEEALQEQFDAIIEANWSGDRSTHRRVIRPRSPLPHRDLPVSRRRRYGGQVQPAAPAEPPTAPARERGPPSRR